MMNAMRALPVVMSLALLSSMALGQASAKAPVFDVASVRPSQHSVGPDYNNQITYSPTGITARNVTLKRLIAEAYRLQMNQIFGPAWIDRNEYDIEARTAGVVSREQMAPMLQSLLAERFNLKNHGETREIGVYELMTGKSGARVRPVNAGETAGAQVGLHFHGDMRQFADLIAVQLAIPAISNPSEPARASGPPIPVVDKTGLEGTFDFGVDIHPEMGTDMFTAWERFLEDQLGLRMENHKGNVEVLVVDDAAKIPTEN
jgi:uncharacterized protein (TIGR03435 family)